MRRSVDGKRRPDLAFEHKLLGDGCFRIAGLDEAGRGAWAGPVVAAAVVLPLDHSDLAKSLAGVRDSKQMTSVQREFWASAIRQIALGIGLGVASSQEVDHEGLIAATREAMARALEVPLEKMGGLSLKSQNAVPMNAQCAIFAESEVVSLIHAKTPKEDIVRAVHDAIASRITSMVRRVGIEREVALVGGVARNVGFVKSMKDDLELEILIPEDPEFVGALGAAIAAAENR